jgi:magnesium chelatase subunit I
VSQRLPIACLESAVSNAERRAVTAQENKVVPRISDIYAAIPAITGKLELEYEGELKGAENVTRDLIRSSLLRTFKHHFSDQKFDQIVHWFDLGGVVKVHDQTPAADYLRKVQAIQGLEETLKSLGISSKKDLPTAISWVEFILEGLFAQKRLSRNEERGYFKEVATEEEEIPGDFPLPRRSFN